MDIIQGFAKNAELSDNANGGVTAPFGELSAISLTFSRNIKNYANSAKFPGVEFVSFKTINDKNVDIDINTFVSNTIVNVGYWTYKQSNAGLIPANTQKTTFINYIIDEFSNLVNSYGLKTGLTNIEIGEILDTPIAGRRLPDYIAFTIKDDTKVSNVKLWFNDNRFQTQYMYYEMEVVPPVGVIDLLNGTTVDVSNLINSTTKTQVINQINAITQNNRETYIYPISLIWHNPKNPTSTLNTEWFVIIYGNAGIDNDAVKDAIRTYIATKSGIKIWTSIYPDLYSESEFVIIPFWDQLASVDNGYDASLYRSAISKAQLANIEVKQLPGSYNTVADFESYKKQNLITASTTYRALMFMSLGNPNNIQGKFNLLMLFPDYMDIPTNSPDFNRMSNNTQNFCLKLNEALHKCFEYSKSKSIPLGYSLATKSNREYLGFDFNGFKFFVMTRVGYLKNT